MSEYILNGDIKEATEQTKKKNREVAKKFQIDLEDASNAELELAKIGCIKKADNIEINDKRGHVVWNLKPYDFLREKKVADSVNPSLWLNGKCNLQAGVYEVLKDKIYQVRGLDIANITFVRSKTGWIVMDVTTSVETARAGISLLEEAIGENVKDNIRAVIISHSHADHFGGIRGVVDEKNVGSVSQGGIPIYVPNGFDEETIKENVYAGSVMFRRSGYQFGSALYPCVAGRVSTGLGIDSANGTISYIRPTDYIKEDCSIVIDGLTVEFQLTPGTEAPAEMNNYFPEYRAFWAAENCTGTLHNLYPIRGAQVRDSSNWWRFTEAALEKYGKITDVVFQSHNWPHFNSPEHPHLVEEYLRNSAAIYKFIHDHTLLYANMGYTAKEIADEIKLPDELEKVWYTRPYYGSIELNVRATYNKYLGFYNGNPVNLDPLTEKQEAEKFVEYVGSEEKVLEKAEEDFLKGNYRWAAKAANHVVYVNPSNKKARYLCADAFEQLGYQSESSIWRNAYLSGAKDLREKNKVSVFQSVKETVASEKEDTKQSDLIENMTTKMTLDYLGILVDGEKIANEDVRFRLQVVKPLQEDKQGSTIYLSHTVEVKEEFLVHIYHGTILYYEGHVEEDIPYVKLPEGMLAALAGRQFARIKDYIDTDCMDILENLSDKIIDLTKYSKFPLIEP